MGHDAARRAQTPARRARLGGHRWRPALAAGLLGLLLAAGCLTAAPAARAAGATVVLQVGSGHLIRLPQPAAKVFVAEPAIADVELASDHTVFVTARKPGRTTFIALDQQDRLILEQTLQVGHSLQSLEDQLRALYPDYHITLASVPGRVILSGSVGAAREAEEILQLVRGQLSDKDEVVNRLGVTGPTQVNLRVRVAELSRTVSERLGINWDNTLNLGSFTFGLVTSVADYATSTLNSGGGTLSGGYSSANGRVNLTGVIDALKKDGVVKVLAEPNLTAASGETASFLAGGEIPIPVRDKDDNITVTFKQVGVLLHFTPTVLAGDRISLKVKPEVSEVDSTRSVVINGDEIPGFSTRRVETTVELGSGQSFVIGGMVRQNLNDYRSGVPGLGDVPLLGHLFRASNLSQEQQELIVVVTPYLVSPLAGGRVPSPLEELQPASDIEQLLIERFASRSAGGSPPAPPPGGRFLHGDPGFIY